MRHHRSALLLIGSLLGATLLGPAPLHATPVKHVRRGPPPHRLKPNPNAKPNVNANANDPSADKRRINAVEDAIGELDATVGKTTTEVHALDANITQRVQELGTTVEKEVQDLSAAVTEVDTATTEVGKQVRDLVPGSHETLFSGNMRVGYSKINNNIGSPDIILRIHPYWRMGDRLLAKVDTQFTYDETNRSQLFLFFAELMYIVNNYVVVKVGQLLPPFGYYQEQIHVEWINKLTDEPLPMQDELIAPTSDLGLMVRAALPLPGLARLALAVSVTNGPQVIDNHPTQPLSLTNNHTHQEPNKPGGLLFGRANDNNDNKGITALARLYLMPELAIGFSTLQARVGADKTAFSKIWASMYDVDVSGYLVAEPLATRFELRMEYVRSQVGRADYDGTGAYANRRSGYYAQLAARPLLVQNDIINRMELVARVDSVSMPDDFPGMSNQRRGTVGLLYWLWPSVVLKADYQVASITPVKLHGASAPTFTRRRIGAMVGVGF